MPTERKTDRVLIIHEFITDAETHEIISHKASEVDKHTASGYIFTSDPAYAFTTPDGHSYTGKMTPVEDNNANS